ncbi:MAG: phosphoglucomutase/phosphomannomutase family protein [Lachnospiraceae bacterium]|nr:phosphoglucomutase/phosphomannomutase family protein [Lachnospiraceae bacterium]
MIKFGTGGWRAVIGDGFTKANIQLLAKGLADKMKAENKTEKGIVIGYDRRFLSKEAMQWAGQVFAAEGIHASLVNKQSPTPLIMYYVMKHELDYGMMITASHNPAVYNGIKVFTAGGRDANEEQTRDIESYIEKIEPGSVKEMDYEDAVRDGYITEIYPLNEYLDNILASIDVEAIKKRGLKVAFDPMYGVSDTSLKTILLTTRCDIAVIHEQHDTLFGGKLPAPNKDTLRQLQNYVVEYSCDLGIATDGDADRLGVIDDTGRYLHANDILVLLYYYLLKYKNEKGAVVRNIATTHMLDRVAESFGEKCYEVPVGFKHISSKMNETDAIIGGESSGGLTIRGHIKGKDGIYAASIIVEMISVTGKKLSEIVNEIEQIYGKLYMVEQNIKFHPSRKEELYKMLMVDKKIPEFGCEIDHVSYMDGCKVYFKNGGWIIARFSGTEPLLRIFCEMETNEAAEQMIKTFENFLNL